MAPKIRDEIPGIQAIYLIDDVVANGGGTLALARGRRGESESTGQAMRIVRKRAASGISGPLGVTTVKATVKCDIPTPESEHSCGFRSPEIIEWE